MSVDLYSTALVWHGYRGIAKLHGRQIELQEPPTLLGQRLVMIDYRPEIAERRLQPFDGQARDMTADEVAAADVFLYYKLPPHQRRSIDAATGLPDGPPVYRDG